MHAVGFMVDPQFQNGDQFTDPEVVDGWDIVLSRLEPNIAKQRAIKDHLADYTACRRRFARVNALADRFTTDPCSCWEDYEANTSELQTLAIKLSQAISSSCLE
eukprot:c35740_g1_i1 orf=130-441(+)